MGQQSTISLKKQQQPLLAISAIRLQIFVAPQRVPVATGVASSATPPDISSAENP